MSATEIADRYWDFYRRHSHFVNLVLGDLTYLELWDDVSDEGEREAREGYESFAKEALRMAADDRTLLETVAAAADMNAAETLWVVELQYPNLQSGLIAFLLPLLAMQPLRTAEDGDRYIAKLAAFPAFIEAVVARLKSGAQAGVVPVDVNVEATIAKLDELVGRPASESRFATQPAPDEDDGSWHDRLVEAVERYLFPGCVRFRQVLAENTLPASRSATRPGLVHLQGGIEVYRRLAKGYTTLDLTPEQIHRIGLDTVAKLENEYLEIGGPLLGETDIAGIYRRLREDESLHHHDADAIVADALRCLGKAKAAVGDWFGRLPVADCIGSPIDVGAMAYYRNPSDDGSVPGQFFFNTADPSAWATFQVAAVAYHEAIPGHHLDTALSMENRDLHDIHRLVYIPAFGEGWGLYSERLADEMGLYESDWERLGMLMADSLRACRLVVDTGMHALGWSRDQAISYLAENSPMSMFEITEEIDRYIGLPGQALAYMLGRIHIVDLRRRAEEVLGNDFDIKGFHDTVLGNGTVPLFTLTRLVEEWVLSRKAAV